MQKIKVLFVCLGNICRSPMGEGIFEHLVAENSLNDTFFIDSAGTSGHHVGELADRRMRQTASSHGVELRSRSRMFIAEDLDEFDFVLAMDRENLKNINAMKSSENGHRAEVILMRDFDPKPEDGNVPDPYYGGARGFEDVYEILWRSNEKLLDYIRDERGF